MALHLPSRPQSAGRVPALASTAGGPPIASSGAVALIALNSPPLLLPGACRRPQRGGRRGGGCVRGSLEDEDPGGGILGRHTGGASH